MGTVRLLHPITALAFNLELWLDSQRLGGQPNNHTNSETQIFNLVLWLDSQRRPYASRLQHQEGFDPSLVYVSEVASHHLISSVGVYQFSFLLLFQVLVYGYFII